jgi:hypothetical protein
MQSKLLPAILLGSPTAPGMWPWVNASCVIAVLNPIRVTAQLSRCRLTIHRLCLAEQAVGTQSAASLTAPTMIMIRSKAVTAPKHASATTHGCWASSHVQMQAPTHPTICRFGQGTLQGSARARCSNRWQRQAPSRCASRSRAAKLQPSAARFKAAPHVTT